MYENPIMKYTDDIINDIVEKEEGYLVETVHKVGFNVDKEELAKALQYDRDQYEKGFNDGRASAEPKWIPVTERLPEVGDYYAEGLRESKPVLVCGKTKYGENGYALAVSTYITDDIDHDDGWSRPYDYADCEMKIVAWMPLPEHYKYPPVDFMNKPEEQNE